MPNSIVNLQPASVHFAISNRRKNSTPRRRCNRVCINTLGRQLTNSCRSVLIQVYIVQIIRNLSMVWWASNLDVVFLRARQGGLILHFHFGEGDRCQTRRQTGATRGSLAGINKCNHRVLIILCLRRHIRRTCLRPTRCIFNGRSLLARISRRNLPCVSS